MPVSITYRSVKGSSLTAAEVDGNFQALSDWIDAFEADPTPPNGIANITQDGTQLTIFLDDSTALGPFTLPSAIAIVPVVEKSASAMTLALADRNTFMRCTHADGCVVTLPLDADSDIPLHAEFHFRQCTSGAVSIEAPSDITINGIAGFLDQTGAVGAVMTLKHVGADEWDLFGLLAEDSTATA